MQSIPPPGDPHSPRLRCARCGFSAVDSEAGWAQLTAVSHAGPTEALERAGHAVGMDVCRNCLRDSLRSALGLPPRGTTARRPSPAPEAPPRADTAGERVHRAMRSMERTDAFIRASERRLARWRGEDGLSPSSDPQGAQSGGSSAASSEGAAASLGATRGEAPANCANGQATASAGSSQRSERSQSRA